MQHLKVKKFYKAPYDKSDIGHNKYEFMNNRRNMLKNLPPIETVESFKMIPIKVKTIHGSVDNIKTDFSYRQMCNIDKHNWFGTMKSVDMQSKANN